MAVEHSAFLEPDVRVAGVRQQPVHLGLEPAPKDASHVVGSVGQIRVGCTGFKVDLELVADSFQKQSFSRFLSLLVTSSRIQSFGFSVYW